jgi:hypothetical protein
MSKYEAVTTYQFKVGQTLYEITDWKSGYVFVSETEFNGQEDTHMSGEAKRVDGKWVWIDQNFDDYDGDADGILAYLNENPPPFAA